MEFIQRVARQIMGNGNDQSIEAKVVGYDSEDPLVMNYQPKLNHNSLRLENIQENIARITKFYEENKETNIQMVDFPEIPLKEYEFNTCFKYIDTEEQLKIALEEIIQHKVIAVDLENHHLYSYNGYLCLMQLTTPDYSTYIIDALALREHMAKYMGEIFENPGIMKVFHGSLHGDITWLQRDFGIGVINVFDTQESYKILTKSQRLSLSNLWSMFCKDKAKFNKEQKGEFQKADWERRPLSEEMLNYAAHDSYFLLYIAQEIIKLYIAKDNGAQQLQHHFQKHNEQLMNIRYLLRREAFKKDYYKSILKKYIVHYDPESDEFLLTDYIYSGLFKLRDYFAERCDKSPDMICDTLTLFVLSSKKPLTSEDALKILEENGISSDSFVSHFIRNFVLMIKQKIAKFPLKKDKIKESYINSKNEGANGYMVRQKKKEERKKNIVKAYSCKKAVYENCKMYAPDGELLSNCDTKKAQWYLDRGLATKIKDVPFTIKLIFEPNGRDATKPYKELYDDNFYVCDRENKCVVCGKDKEYSRFHVIPTLYRTQFPNELKSHRSHDIVLLCFGCHEVASRHQDKLKIQLSEQYNVPLNEHNPNKQVNLAIQCLNKTAVTLHKGHIIPDDKLKQLNGLILKTIQENNALILNYIPQPYHKDIEDGIVSKDLVKFLLKMEQLKLSNKDKQNPHGRVIVDIIQKEDKMADFIKLWRANFLNNMNPKYLPQGWRVDHTIERSFGIYSKFNKEGDQSVGEVEYKYEETKETLTINKSEQEEEEKSE